MFEVVGCMDGEIKIKLCEGSSYRTIRHVSHAMKELLIAGLDQLCKEKIVDIIEPIECLIPLCQKAKWKNKVMSRSNTFEQVDHQAQAQWLTAWWHST